MLVTEMLVASGLAAVAGRQHRRAAGRGDRRPGHRGVRGRGVVVPAHLRHRSRPRGRTWLNFAPDHLDVHLDLAGYEAAKARIWADQPPTTSPSPTPTTRWSCAGRRRRRAPQSRFGLREPADWHASSDGWLVGPDGLRIVPAAELTRVAAPRLRQRPGRVGRRRWPPAPSLDGVRDGSRVPSAGLPHRVELVGEAGGVRWYDDSKATAPHATLAALRASTSVVLIAGGRNKGLDLSELAGSWRRTSAPSSPSARPRPRSRPRSPGRRPVVAATRWTTRSPRPPRSPSRATPWCCRRPAPRSTGTAPTASGATTSPRGRAHAPRWRLAS